MEVCVSPCNRIEFAFDQCIQTDVQLIQSRLAQHRQFSCQYDAVRGHKQQKLMVIERKDYLQRSVTDILK